MLLKKIFKLKYETDLCNLNRDRREMSVRAVKSLNIQASSFNVIGSEKQEKLFFRSFK